ncbi:unnamed protein product [Colias eurytheme]|nr:unnamed protein product [Colias eurytheme]
MLSNLSSPPHKIRCNLYKTYSPAPTPPLVVLLNEQRHGTVYDLAEDASRSLEEKHDDEGAYFLFHLLRTTQENEPLDPETDRTFEKTKSILGEALRARCNRYDRCVKRCVKKRYTCTVSCREEYDVYEVCEQNINVSGKTESLLSRLYRKAQSSNRPLIVILDNSYLKEKRLEQQYVNPLIASSDETAYIPPMFGSAHDPRLEENKNRKLSTRPPPTRQPKTKPKNTKKKSFRARDKDDGQRDVRSPIVKSLLRISNDLRCDAKDECVDVCKGKYIGIKKTTCVVKCEVTYECKKEEDSCRSAECEINSCESDDCEDKTGSTKGYAISDEGPWCKNGRC